MAPGGFQFISHRLILYQFCLVAQSVENYLINGQIEFLSPLKEPSLAPHPDALAAHKHT